MVFSGTLLEFVVVVATTVAAVARVCVAVGVAFL